MLVGAPNAETNQKNVSFPGDVYICSIDKSPSCRQLMVDKQGKSDKYSNFIDEEVKDFQRLGTSLTSYKDSVVVRSILGRLV